MTLANIYSISVRHQRSARIDSDLTSNFFDGFVYHGTAQHALETILRQYTQKKDSNYTITGPYGSGKSTIALLLMGLLSHNTEIQHAARSVLNEQSLKEVNASLPVNKGWLQIRSVSGVRNPLETFWEATLNALRDHPNTHETWLSYQEIATSNEATLIANWKKLFIEIKDKVDGVLLIADEMGKTLEYINRTGGQLHLFQDIPEIICRLGVPFLFVGLLHQAFSEYTKERGIKLQEEWGKIQGRYTDIHYSVSTDETVALIAKSIIKKGDICTENAYVTKTLTALNDTDDRKNSLKSRLLQSLPLHPLVTLLLGPLSKRRFSQNERSTFAFLNSYETNGLQLFLKNTTESNRLYTLADLWDYLEVNLEHSILSSPDAHAWAEAAEVIRRAPNDDILLQLLKSIALINIFGSVANLYATEDILLAALNNQNQKSLQESLEKLKNSACIVFRKFQSEWVIFEGSDIDISAELEKKVEQLSGSLEPLEHIDFSNYVIAKRHYHETGTIRWANKNIYIDLPRLKSDLDKLKQKRKGAFANFVLLLNKPNPTELKDFSNEHKDLALSIAGNTDDIKVFATELYALELLKNEKDFGDALQHDKVAAREFASRFNDATQLLSTAIEEGFRHSIWYFFSHSENKNSLSHIASSLADLVYENALNIRNEIINRNKLSGTAVAACKKLLEAMIENQNCERLGIIGFPPEFSMYSSCLKETGLHVLIDEKWQFSTSNISHRHSELNELIEQANNLLNNKSGEIVNLSEIEAMWSAPPFGVTQGIIPIVLLAYLKSLGNTIAFFEKSSNNQMAFIAEPDVDFVHKLQKNIKDLGVKLIVLEEKENRWLTYLSNFSSGLTGRTVKQDLLSITQLLVTTVHNLPHWVRNAINLDNDPKQNRLILTIRDLFLQANDPYSLLIKDLPKALKRDEINDFDITITELEKCFATLIEAHAVMLSKLDKQVQETFPYDSDRLIEMCNFVESRSGNLRLKAFAREISRSQISTNKHNNWLESLISIVVGRTINSWNQNLLLDASNQIGAYAQEFLHLIKVAELNDKESSKAPATKTISLVLEDDNGKLVSYKKEIHLSDQKKINDQMSTVSQQLKDLTDFERIEVLQNLLKQTLEIQG